MPVSHTHLQASSWQPDSAASLGQKPLVGCGDPRMRGATCKSGVWKGWPSAPPRCGRHRPDSWTRPTLPRWRIPASVASSSRTLGASDRTRRGFVPGAAAIESRIGNWRRCLVRQQAGSQLPEQFASAPMLSDGSDSSFVACAESAALPRIPPCGISYVMARPPSRASGSNTPSRSGTRRRSAAL